MPFIEEVGRARRTAVVLACLLAFRGAGAQSIRGVVHGAATGGVLSGVVVVLRDSASGDLVQTVTNSRGAFVLHAPAAGSYLLRARLIGFRPTDLRFRLSLGDTTLAVVMSDVPVTFAAVVTRSAGHCRAHPESGSATWALWDDAEIAMLNAVITMREQRYRFDAEFVRRWYDMNPAQLSQIGIHDSTVRDSRPWTSVRPDVLGRSGYAFETPTEMTVIAPDLPILLSHDFLDGHCFAIHEASGRRPELVGLDFKPTARGRYVDIRGTFWIDRQSSEVRYLDYYYDGFPFSMSDTLAGGRVKFTRLPTGSWILSSWWIRSPVPPAPYLAYTVLSTSRPLRAVESGDPHFRAIEFTVTAGSVRQVSGDGDADTMPVWSAPVSALRMNVTEHGASGPVPAAGAIVQLVGSRRQVVADGSGVAVIDGMLEGEYIVDVTAQLQAELRLPPSRSTVVVEPPGDVTIHARVMTPGEAVQAVCGAMSMTSGILTGTVTKNGAPEPRASVSVRSDVDPHFAKGVKVLSDGTFSVCDVPRGEALTVTAHFGGSAQAKAYVKLAPDQIHGSVDLVLPPER
ncbi:MAG TPA: carboxypeptidase-like regulatory domain-containing protein [Gemmatimonadaceae bacterium]|jgi:hypothetical protein